MRNGGKGYCQELLSWCEVKEREGKVKENTMNEVQNPKKTETKKRRKKGLNRESRERERGA